MNTIGSATFNGRAYRTLDGVPVTRGGLVDSPSVDELPPTVADVERAKRFVELIARDGRRLLVIGGVRSVPGVLTAANAWWAPRTVTLGGLILALAFVEGFSLTRNGASVSTSIVLVPGTYERPSDEFLHMVDLHRLEDEGRL